MPGRAVCILSFALLLAGCTSHGVGLAGNSLVGVCGCDIVPNVGDRVFFDFNASTLSIDDDATLGRQGAWLTKYPKVNVLIAGNADERGTETYNLALGHKRADAARNYLVAEGISPARIHTTSYGKDCPIATGNDEASYQQNRVAITSVAGQNPQNCH